MISLHDIPEDGIVFYDSETTSVNAPYCKLKLLAYQVGLNGKPELVDLGSRKSRNRFRDIVGSDMYKVSYNGINFDDIVLWRHGMWVNPKNRHDCYLMLKTVHPTFPSYNLKFVNFMLDMNQTDKAAVHWPEYLMERWLADHKLDKKWMYTVPKRLLEVYCMHDVRQTCNVFKVLWEIVQKRDPIDHWTPYNTLELAMAEPLHEMILLGREYINLDDIQDRIADKEQEVLLWKSRGQRWTKGEIDNIGSSKQVTSYLWNFHGVKFGETENGELQLTKLENVQEIRQGVGGRETALYNPEDLERYGTVLKVRIGYYETHAATKMLGYLRSYSEAGEFEQRRIRANRERKKRQIHAGNSTVNVKPGGNSNRFDESDGIDSKVSIPKGYYLSGARTRRFQSRSKYGINFQNQNKESKIIQLVPSGWIAFYLDSTQIENVTHIWASRDKERREAYTLDPDWNEYVWLTNRIRGGEASRETLDKITSEVNPSWSIYKQFKTIKLAMNFGMGPDKFSNTTGLSIEAARDAFEQVHAACPAIRKLQRLVKEQLEQDGYIKDPFGHIYSGESDEIYKVVAYLIQGCGTGSIPKAMTVANFRTIHREDRGEPIYRPYVYHPFKRMYSFGVLTGTTHDECAGRLSLGMSTERIVQILQELLYNMEEKFSSKFDGIPLRAKLSVSIENASEAEEINHHNDLDKFKTRLIEIIEEGKQKQKYEKQKRKLTSVVGS